MWLLGAHYMNAQIHCCDIKRPEKNWCLKITPCSIRMQLVNNVFSSKYHCSGGTCDLCIKLAKVAPVIIAFL